MSSVLLTYVFPGVGCVLSFCMFSSSLAAVLKVRKTRRLGVRFNHISWQPEVHGAVLISVWLIGLSTYVNTRHAHQKTPWACECGHE